MTVEFTATGRTTLKDALTVKRINADYLIQIIKAEWPGTVQLASVTITNFSSSIRRLCATKRFRSQILPAVIDGSFSEYEALSPRPSPELCKWAAERLVSESDGLFVRNAQSWRELIYTLFSQDGALIAETLEPDQREQVRASFEAWKHENPEIFRPIFKEAPTSKAVGVLFRTFLGRPPNKNDDVQERQRQGYPAIIRAFLLSKEFQKVYLQWLGRGPLSHEKSCPNAVSSCASELTRVFAWQNDGGPNLEVAARNWSDLLDAIWLVDSRRSDVLSLLSDEENSIDGFIRVLIEHSCWHIKHGSGQRLVTAVLEGTHIKGVLINETLQSGAVIEAQVLANSDGSLMQVPIDVQSGGRQSFTIDLELAALQTEAGGSALSLSLDGTAANAMDVLRRPMLGEGRALAAKTAWHWTKGNFARAEGNLLDLDATDDAGLAHSIEIVHRRLAGLAEETPTLVARRLPEWQDFSSAIAARKQGVVREAPLPPEQHAWVESLGDAGRALSAWLFGGQDETGLTAALNAVSTETPSSNFEFCVRKLDRMSDLISLLKSLTLIGANDAHLAGVTSALLKHPKKRVNNELRRDENAIALGGAICACAELPDTASLDLGAVTGAAKYCEVTARPNKALNIALASVNSLDNPPLNLINLASTLSNKWGDAHVAADLLKIAINEQPDNTDLMERYLSLERAVGMADPLRITPEVTKLKRRFREGRVKALIQRPGDTSRLHALGRALLIEGDETGALDIYNDLYARGEISSDGLKRLIDLCVKTGDHARVIEICELLEADELSEWLIINHVRALRALDRAEEAGELLDRHASPEWQSVSREAVRNLFFLADFEGAARRGDELLACQPEDIELRLIVAAAHLELDNLEEASALVSAARDLPKAVRFEEELDLFSYAISRKQGIYLSIRKLNPMLRRLGCSDLAIKLGSAGNFDDFTLAPEQQAPAETEFPPLTDGPLVSVVMTSYNSSDFIDTAIESILNQRYRNIELIVVDDMSTDDTPNKLLRWRDADTRVRPILKTENSGTYVSKNMGLLSALGTYVALQDSDDWSHPDRIGKSVAVLERRKDLQALTTDWLRMTTNGNLMVKAGGQISHVCCISLVFRRQQVMDAIGLFDSVRIEADMEYIRRIQLAFGRRALVRLRWPLLFGRVRSDSLTGNEEFGISRTGFSPPRLEYQAHQAAWHDRIRRGDSPFMPFPLKTRKFDAPGIILPNRPGEEA
ncbi:MAG: glycosyltransferase family A protein [Pseudomonadota bacterium]